MRNVCWAAELGGCSAKMSAEHPISQSLFDAELLEVHGGPWGEGRQVPRRSLATRCLCVVHNRMRSDIEGTVGSFVKDLRRMNGHETAGTVPINGYVLERWLLQAMLGICASGWHRPGGVVTHLVCAPIELAQVAFGLRPFDAGCGLHALTYTANFDAHEERVSWELLPANPTGTEVAGIVLLCSPFTFALALVPGDPTPAVRSLRPRGLEATGIEAHYRPAEVTGRATSGGRITVRFDW